jgi:hypothetical protein
VRVDEPEPSGWHPEPRLGAAHAQVAGQRQLEPAADGVPADRGDHRERNSVERLQRGVNGCATSAAASSAKRSSGGRRCRSRRRRRGRRRRG